VSAATKGKRGQVFFKDMLEALDAMPDKRLIAENLEANGEFCALGALGNSRGIDMTDIDPEDPEQVCEEFDIARALAKEVVYMNDESCFYNETPEARWIRMREWVSTSIVSG